MMTEIRLLLVDDHAILRDGLRSFLSLQQDFLVVGEAKNGEEAIRCVEDLRPDVVLMDIAMPESNGLEATRLISQKYPKSRVLILSQHEDHQYVLPSLKAGAAGYLLKSAMGEDLVGAIRLIYSGENFLDPSLSKVVVDEIRSPNVNKLHDVEHLTKREQEILKYIVLGLSNSQIAANLSLSIKTVEWHRTNLMSKLDIHNVVDLVRFALQNGLVKGEL